MLTTITAVGGLLGLAASVVLLALQTREATKQTKISNNIAAATALMELLGSVREAHGLVFLEHPELRAYFYDDKRCPRRGRRRAQVLTTADMLADCLDTALLVSALVPGRAAYEEWVSFSRYILGHSPVIAALVSKHPDWWCALAQLLEPPN